MKKAISTCAFVLILYQLTYSQYLKTPPHRWPTTTITYNYAYADPSFDDGIDAAAHTWDTDCGVNIAYDPSSTNNIGSSDLGGADANNADTYMEMSLELDAQGVYISQAQISINTNWSILWSTDVNQTVLQDGFTDVWSLALHEFGHWLYLGDNTNSSSIMDAGQIVLASQNSPYTPDRTPSATDISNVTNLYNTTAICDYCPPTPPPNLNVTISSDGQSVILSWKAFTDQMSGLEVLKNGNYLWDVPQGNVSYVDVDALNSLPSTYQLASYANGYTYYSPPVTVSLAPATIASNTTWSGTVFVNGNVTINRGVTLNVSPGTNMVFNAGHNYSVLANGSLVVWQANFTSNSSLPSAGNWGSIVLNGSGANGSSISYANINYGTGVQVVGANNVTVQNCKITNNSSNGIYLNSSAGCLMQYNTIANSNTCDGISLNGSTNDNCYYNVIYKYLNQSPGYHCGAAINYSGGSSGKIVQNDIANYGWGIAASYSSSPSSPVPPGSTRNNRVTNCLYGFMVFYQSYLNFGEIPPTQLTMYNSVHNNVTDDADVGYVYPAVASALDADADWWEAHPSFR